MNFDLEDRQWKYLVTHLFQPLEARGAKIWIFGSRAKKTNQKFSDLDVLYEVRGDQSTEIRSFVAGLTETLENSSLPIKVDVVAVEDLAESYKDDVFKTRVPVRT